MNLLKLILESKDFRKSLEDELNVNFSKYNPGLHIGMYSKDRPDDDPLKDKGFGTITFRYRDDLPQELFEKAIAIVERLGGEVTGKRNQYEAEPGERDYYPTIKFSFSV